MKGRPSCFLFEIVLLFTFLLLPFYFLPFPLRYFTSPSHLHIGCHSELYDPCLQAQQVRVCGGFLSVIPACSFFHKFVPCGGDQVVVMLVIILLLTFRFLLVLLFALLSHRIVPHPELVDMRTVPAPNYALLCYLRRRMTLETPSWACRHSICSRSRNDSAEIWGGVCLTRKRRPCGNSICRTVRTHG